MAKKVIMVFDEQTGKFAIDMDGYDGDGCKEDAAKLIAALRAEGIEVDVEDVEDKAPVVPTGPTRQKVKA